MKLNVLKLSHLLRPRTHEGAPAVAVTPELALRRSVLACMLWEDEFYEDGVAIAGRIRELVPKVEAAKVAARASRISSRLKHSTSLARRSQNAVPQPVVWLTVESPERTTRVVFGRGIAAGAAGVAATGGAGAVEGAAV
jgi:hypothetical protein